MSLSITRVYNDPVQMCESSARDIKTTEALAIFIEPVDYRSVSVNKTCESNASEINGNRRTGDIYRVSRLHKCINRPDV